MNTADQDTVASGDSGRFHFHRSHPPESMFMLTPMNDPESTFAQRPRPPRRTADHSFMTEVNESLVAIQLAVCNQQIEKGIAWLIGPTANAA